jgi:pimeloyl-ACP methyl ester carboxylesterase
VRNKTRSIMLSFLLAGGLTGCSGGADPAASSSPDATVPSPTPTPTDASVIEGSFDVGDHSLFLVCEGEGSPTVVYFHGLAEDPGSSGKENGVQVAAALRDDYRVCRYDRANVGDSDTVEGEQTADDAVADLHALLRAADVPGPYVLLGASFGGLVAYDYAVTYPRGIEGMVVLDPTLPREDVDIDPYYHPVDGLLTGEEWKDIAEHMDYLDSMSQTQALEGREPAIPLTYIALKHPEVWWSPVTNESMKAYRAMQQRFVDLWSPGTMLILDVPHFMEPIIPDRIGDEVRGVIAAAEGGP